jgi:hypothetical protein
MKSHHFAVMGTMRSYWDFLFGYGLFVTIALLVQALLFWRLAAFAKTNPALTKPIVGLFCLTCARTAALVKPSTRQPAFPLADHRLRQETGCRRRMSSLRARSGGTAIGNTLKR